MNGSKGILIVARGNLSEEEPTFLWMVQTVSQVPQLRFTGPFDTLIHWLPQCGPSTTASASIRHLLELRSPRLQVGPVILSFNKPHSPTPRGDS